MSVDMRHSHVDNFDQKPILENRILAPIKSQESLPERKQFILIFEKILFSSQQEK